MSARHPGGRRDNRYGWRAARSVPARARAESPVGADDIRQWITGDVCGGRRADDIRPYRGCRLPDRPPVIDGIARSYRTNTHVDAVKVQPENDCRVAIMQAFRIDRGEDGPNFELITDTSLLSAFLELMICQGIDVWHSGCHVRFSSDLAVPTKKDGIFDDGMVQ